MIPDNPNWSALTGVKAYPRSPLAKPWPLPDVVQDAKLGPAALSASNGKLTSRYWVASQEDGLVVIRGSEL